jgi:argininosuccinate synthase
MSKRVVLAYCGGLEASVAVHQMAEEQGFEVVAVTVDVGQGADFQAIGACALAAGAVESIVIDATEELATDYLLPALQANLGSKGRACSVSALSMPLIVQQLVAVAGELGASAVAHGCNGDGSSRAHFELGIATLAPQLQILAPVRDAPMQRAGAAAYVEQHAVECAVGHDRPGRVEGDLWRRVIDGGALDRCLKAPCEDFVELTAPSARSPVELLVSFEAGVPSGLDGRELPLAQLIGEVGRRAESGGFGRLGMLESPLGGSKQRMLCEAPVALALTTAHEDLERCTLDRDLAKLKSKLAERLVELVNEGAWFSLERAAIGAFVAVSQAPVTGEVRVVLEPGGGCRVESHRRLTPRAKRRLEPVRQ